MILFDDLIKAHHPFLVGLEYAFQTPEKIFLVMQFLRGGELYQHLKAARRFPEERARFYAAEIALALEYLHQKDIIYRDLKPENILLDDEGHICLADFGLSKYVGNNIQATTIVGTPEYLGYIQIRLKIRINLKSPGNHQRSCPWESSRFMEFRNFSVELNDFP